MRFLAPFTIFAAMGLAGVASLIPTLGPTIEKLRGLPNPPTQSDVGLIALILVQPTLLVLLAITAGILVTERIGMRSYLLAWSRGLKQQRPFRTGLAAAIGLAFAVGTIVVAQQLLFAEMTEPGSLKRLAGIDHPVDWAARLSAILYGGIAEELMLRFGLMGLLVWLGRLVFRKTLIGRPGLLVGPAIVISSLLFGLGHLPVLFATVSQPSTALVLHIVFLNALAGIAYGWLYWRHSLEHAMLSHALTHVTFWIVRPSMVSVGAHLAG